MKLDEFFKENDDWRPYADLVACPPLPEELMKEFTDVNPEAIARSMEFVQEGGGFVTRGALYIRIRREDRKCGDRWATMLALQAPPGIQTSDTFWAGRKSWVDCYGENYANLVKKGLAAKGISLKSGDEYCPELVRTGYGPKNPDPEAVVPFGGGRSYIKSLCEKRNWSLEGCATVEPREPESDPLAPENCVPLAEKVIRQKAAGMIKRNPELGRLSKGEMRDKVLAKYGPPR